MVWEIWQFDGLAGEFMRAVTEVLHLSINHESMADGALEIGFAWIVANPTFARRHPCVIGVVT